MGKPPTKEHLFQDTDIPNPILFPQQATGKISCARLHSNVQQPQYLGQGTSRFLEKTTQNDDRKQCPESSSPKDNSSCQSGIYPTRALKTFGAQSNHLSLRQQLSVPRLPRLKKKIVMFASRTYIKAGHAFNDGKDFFEYFSLSHILLLVPFLIIIITRLKNRVDIELNKS